MSRKSKLDLLTEQAQRLFAQRVYLVTHVIVFVVAIILTRGRVVRLGMIFGMWGVLVFLHGAYFALYENKEALLRRTYMAMEDDDEPDKLKHDELDDAQNYYTIGADGELVPLDKDSEDITDAG